MNKLINGIKDLTKANLESYSPVFYRLNNDLDKHALSTLIEESKLVFVHDMIYGQLKELIKCRNVGVKLTEEDYQQKIEEHLKGIPLENYGVWVFYPWSGRLVHLLDHEEFVELRTNRNQYKITRAELELLSHKKIGVVGLSVGQSVALTLAQERICGHLVLADFDELELSNLNRIRTGVHNLGLNKVIAAAREIAEIDPFLKITCYTSGLTTENIDLFFTDGGKLDLLVEECDGLDMKIIARVKAKALGVPVIMDTSDRGMLDVERFDLEPNRPLLHGLVDNLDLNNIKGLSEEDKVPIILQLLGLEQISVRGKVSMIEVNQTINTWPQLASSVTLGGALVTDTSRRLLLNQFTESGRFYIDFEDLVKNKPVSNNVTKPLTRTVPYAPMLIPEMELLADQYFQTHPSQDPINEEWLIQIVEAACSAPSTGNDQPWKWLYKRGILFLFHDEYRSSSFGDFQKIASFLTFGAAYENLYLYARSRYDLEATYSFFPLGNNQRLVAAILFQPNNDHIVLEQNVVKELSAAIPLRHTNRNSSRKIPVDDVIIGRLKNITESIEGANFQWTVDDQEIHQLGKIIGICDRIRIFNDEGHIDFAQREMRWTEEDAERTRDGIFIKTLGLNQAQLAALKVIKNHDVIKTLRDFGGGKAFEVLANKGLSNASAMCFITMPQYSLKNFFEGGRALERFWLSATNMGIAVHPLISPLYLFPRVLHAQNEGISDTDAKELLELHNTFTRIFKSNNEQADVFLTKIAFAEEPTLKTLRLPINQVLFFSSTK